MVLIPILVLRSVATTDPADPAVVADLWAKVTRALYYDLVDMGEERMIDGEDMFGVESGGEFFAMADAEQVRNAR